GDRDDRHNDVRGSVRTASALVAHAHTVAQPADPGPDFTPSPNTTRSRRNTMTDVTAPATEHELEQANGNPFSDPAAPLTIRVRLERWVDDYAYEVDSVEFDGRA